MSSNKPASKYVQRTIRERDIENEEHRQYVKTLLEIESYVLGGSSVFASGTHKLSLRRKYVEEYEAILKELCPIRYERYLEAKAEEERRCRKFEEEALQERLREDEEFREMWQKCQEDGE